MPAPLQDNPCTWTYDDAAISQARPTKRTDPRSNRTTYTYDLYGNPDTITGQEGSVTDHDFDIRGRRTAVKDPNGNSTRYTYDSLDYPATIVHPGITAYALPAGSSPIQRFTYDPVEPLGT